MPSEEPIALIHWGDPAAECNEIEDIKLLLEATLFGGDKSEQAEKAPMIVTRRIKRPEPDALCQALTDFISDHDHLQVLYFSCHGNTSGFAFRQGDDADISYSEFSSILLNSLRNNDCVHIVFGSCKVMAAKPHVEESMPTQMYAITGFIDCPKPTDVSGLIVSIIQDDVALFQKLITESLDSYGTGCSPNKMVDAIEKWKCIVKHHKEEPTREVPGTDGIAVVQATRDVATGEWQRRTILCT